MPNTIFVHLNNIDLTVEIDEEASSCFTVVFTVRLRVVPLEIAAALAPTYKSFLKLPALPNLNQNVARVEVLVSDDCGHQQLVELTMPVSASNEEQTVEVTLPTDRCNITPGSWSRTYFVVADPFSRLAEVNEGNNSAKSVQSCIT